MSGNGVSAVEKNPPVKLPNEPTITAADRGRARPVARRVPARAGDHGPHADHGRARHLLGDVERALLLQVLQGLAEEAADQGAVGHPGPGRECRRDRHRRRPGRHLQDGEPQPPLLHRALPGRGDGRGRHHARRLHHGRAAGGQPQCAALRRSGASQDAAPGVGRRRRHRRLWQLHGHPDGGRRDQLPCRLQRQHPGQRHDRGHRADRPHLLCRRRGRRQSAGLCRLQDRARRHPRRHHVLDRIQRGQRKQAADRAGRRSVRREAAARSLPGADGDRRHRRHPGHGRGRPHLLVVRDGGQGRAGRGRRARQGADARDRHEPLRAHALRKPGAHADRAEARPRRAGAQDLREVGARLRRHRPSHRHRAHGAELARRHRRQHPDPAAGHRGAGLRAAVDADAAAGRARRRQGAGAQGLARLAAGADELPRSREQGVDLAPVRSSHHGQHGDPSAGRRRRSGARQWRAQGRWP